MDGTLLNKKYNLEERVSALEEGGGYELPVASDDTLGGVKVGDGLSINENGVLSNSQTPYTPPDYSTSEVDTGVKWIDGKNIFRKVYNNVELTNNVDVLVEDGFASTKNVIDMHSIFTAIDTGGTQVIKGSSYVAAGNSYAYPCVINGALKIVVNGDMHEFTGFLVVEYTKVTTSETKKSSKK